MLVSPQGRALARRPRSTSGARWRWPRPPPALVWNEERGWLSLTLDLVERRAPTDPATARPQRLARARGTAGPFHPLVFPASCRLATLPPPLPAGRPFPFLALASRPVLLFFWVMMARSGMPIALDHGGLHSAVRRRRRPPGRAHRRLSPALRCFIAVCLADHRRWHRGFYAYAQYPSLRRFLPRACTTRPGLLQRDAGWPEVRLRSRRRPRRLDRHGGGQLPVRPLRRTSSLPLTTDPPSTARRRGGRSSTSSDGGIRRWARRCCTSMTTTTATPSAAVLPDRACRRSGPCPSSGRAWRCSATTSGPARLRGRRMTAWASSSLPRRAPVPARVSGLIVAGNSAGRPRCSVRLPCSLRRRIGLASRLRLETGFETLLPESRPSVIELNRVSARTSSLSTLFVVLEGQDRRGCAARPTRWSPRSGARPALGRAASRTASTRRWPSSAARRPVRRPRNAEAAPATTSRPAYAYEVGKADRAAARPRGRAPPPHRPQQVKQRLGVKATPTSAASRRRPLPERRREDGDRRHPHRGAWAPTFKQGRGGCGAWSARSSSG